MHTLTSILLLFRTLFGKRVATVIKQYEGGKKLYQSLKFFPKERKLVLNCPKHSPKRRVTPPSSPRSPIFTPPPPPVSEQESPIFHSPSTQITIASQVSQLSLPMASQISTSSPRTHITLASQGSLMPTFLSEDEFFESSAQPAIKTFSSLKKKKGRRAKKKRNKNKRKRRNRKSWLLDSQASLSFASQNGSASKPLQNIKRMKKLREDILQATNTLR